MKKLKIPRNLTTLAYHSIKDYILEGRLDENSRLTEEFLSSQLGISKSPIREALNRLETEGLIRIEPRKGAYLRKLSRREVAELYDLREALEAHVMRTAKLTPAVFSDLRSSLKRQRVLLKANDRAGYIEEDVHFHAQLAQATGNAHLCAALENVQNQIWLSRRNTYDLSSSTAPDHHESIVEALDANDRVTAECVMRGHIQNVKGRLLEFLVTNQYAEAGRLTMPEI
ncbi:Transcriptional regulator, GntR family [Candidatus Sulfopaludibacter sp. SbA3]|nr:Transcriptional regulator, GntR family [Candidatus Sulfopaludibacter sp. SbA3]